MKSSIIVSMTLLIFVTILLILFLCYTQSNYKNGHPRLSRTAFYLNLDKHKRRNIHTQGLLRKIGFEKMTRVKPINAKNSETSCLMTHKHILKKIAEMKSRKYYFIFEDDIDLVPDIHPKKVFKYIRNTMNKNIQDNLKLEFIFLGIGLDEELNNNCTTNNCRGVLAHAYMVTPRAARHLLDHVIDDTIPIDESYKTNLPGQPLIGIEYNMLDEEDKNEQWCKYFRGIFYQNRKADWYDKGMSGVNSE